MFRLLDSHIEINVMYFYADIKGKKKRDGIGSPDKASTPSVPCEGFPPDMEGQKRPIINDEILALQITEDDLVKVSCTFDPRNHCLKLCVAQLTSYISNCCSIISVLVHH